MVFGVRVQLTILFLFIYCFTFSQRNLKLGFIGVLDNKHNVFHGINIDIAISYPSPISVNGISVGGLVGTGIERMNGICISGLYTDIQKVNGMHLGFGFSSVGHLNGMFVNLVAVTEKMNGVNFCVIGGGVNSLNGIGISLLAHGGEEFNGLTVAPINLTRVKYTGVQIGLFNWAGNANGIQFGLVNFIKENPKWCRVLPIINMRFKK